MPQLHIMELLVSSGWQCFGGKTQEELKVACGWARVGLQRWEMVTWSVSVVPGWGRVGRGAGGDCLNVGRSMRKLIKLKLVQNMITVKHTCCTLAEVLHFWPKLKLHQLKYKSVIKPAHWTWYCEIQKYDDLVCLWNIKRFTLNL